ncbi:VOC family protein [Patescibacteria group bacterium]|nr:VOC family protein [Patescibacteria group bacterium]
MVSKDPTGHIKISVSNIGKSKSFYKKLFEALGYTKINDWEEGLAYKTPWGFGIWITKAEQESPAYKHGAPGLHHFCVKAVSKEQVDQLYQLVLAEGEHVFNKPKAYPEYTPNYYAVFFADPDGIKLEVAYY